MKIRSQLLLVMVIALFSVASLVGGVQLYAAYYQARENMQTILQNQANQFSNQLNNWFTIIRQNGHFFVNEDFVQQANQEEMQKLLGNMHNELNVFDNLIVTTPEGVIRNVYPYDAKLIGRNMAYYGYFADTVTSKAPQISQVTLNEMTSQFVIVITQPIINRKGELTAVLLQNIKLDLLYDMAEDAKIGQNGKTIIFAADGKVIAPRSNRMQGLSYSVPDQIVEILRKDLRSVGQFTREDGEEILVATIHVRTPGWGVAVTVPQREVWQSFYDSMKYGVVAFCIIFIVLAFAASLVFNRLFRSITIVTEHFASMNEEHFSSTQISEELIASAPQELRKLCSNFNTMAETIQNNIKAIRKANQALLVSEERWQLALRGSNDGIWDWDIGTDQTFFSAQANQMFGYLVGDLSCSMEEWRKKIHPDDYESVMQILQDHLAHKTEFFRVEYRFYCYDNSLRWAFSKGQAVWDFAGIPVRIVGSITDVTPRKFAEAALQQAYEQLEIKVELRTQDLLAMNEELQAVNDELQQALATLQQTQTQLIQSEKMASLGNLVAGIAHEINTPVGVGVTATSHLQKITMDFTMLYEAGGLRRQDLMEYLLDCKEATTIIFSNLERASQLIQSFKQVSVDQSSEGKRIFNVKRYLGEILLSLQPKLKRTHHKVIITCDENLNINSFPGAFGQIITNLVMNSLIHAYEANSAGRITIGVETQGEDQVSLIYADDGKGMASETLNKIFNPFFTTKRGMGGTGLGLYILYNIVAQQFGGTIQCFSELGKGTTFVMVFPIMPEILLQEEG